MPRKRTAICEDSTLVGLSKWRSASATRAPDRQRPNGSAKAREGSREDSSGHGVAAGTARCSIAVQLGRPPWSLDVSNVFLRWETVDALSRRFGFGARSPRSDSLPGGAVLSLRVAGLDDLNVALETFKTKHRYE